MRATFYEDLAERLTARRAGGLCASRAWASADVDVHDVPGAFELPLAAKACAESGRYAGVACLGAVIRGETDHYDYVCEAAAYGISRVQLDTGVPCAFGVLTVDEHGPGAGPHRRRQARFRLQRGACDRPDGAPGRRPCGPPR